jgi:hypothetical protein
MRVCAAFIRVYGQIINVSEIVRIGTGTDIDGDPITWMVTKTGHHGNETTKKNISFQWDGDLIDEIWDILQAASTDHLDPHDKLREVVVL